MTRSRLALILGMFLLLPTLDRTHNAALAAAAPSQPLDERRAQDALPKAKDTLWTLFAKVKVSFNQNRGTYSAVFSEDVKKLDGQPIKISGFMLPLEATDTFKHFLLSKRTPTCPYCPPGEPNEILEVYTAQPVAYEENLSVFEGTFALAEDKEAGIFLTLKDAVKK